MAVPLDPAGDPDRYDPDRDDAFHLEGPPGPLDPALDPDRYDPAADVPVQRPGRPGETLTDMLGAGAYDDKPSPYIFLLGLLAVVAFLGLVAFIFSNLSP